MHYRDVFIKFKSARTFRKTLKMKVVETKAWRYLHKTQTIVTSGLECYRSCYFLHASKKRKTTTKKLFKKHLQLIFHPDYIAFYIHAY